ncbi:MAG: ABC transporter permease subunit [Dehalococcoidia bacterium]
MRILRSQMLEVMHNDYIRTAFAKGLRGRSVWVGHALKNAMLPVLTALGFAIAQSRAARSGGTSTPEALPSC